MKEPLPSLAGRIVENSYDIGLGCAELWDIPAWAAESLSVRPIFGDVLPAGFLTGSTEAIIAIRPFLTAIERSKPMLSPEKKELVAPILGRIPSGVFIMVAANSDGHKTGLLASWVQQASFEPPQVTVAVNKSRYLNDWLTAGAPITLNQVPKGDGVLFKHFGKGFEPDAEAFEGVDCVAADNGLPLLTAALSSLEGTVASSMDAGDHVIYLVDITSAKAHRDPVEFEPFVHVRKNGFSY